MTSAFTLDAARKMGLLQALQRVGGDIVPDTCSDQPCRHFLKDRTGVTDSPKLAYCPRKRGLRFVLRDMRTGVEAAAQGAVK